MLLQGLEMSGSLEPLANAQKGTAGARVVFDLVRSRADRRSSRGVYSPTTRNVERSYDYVCKLPGRDDRSAFPFPHDRSSNLASASFFSVFKDQIGQLTLVELIHHICRRLTATLVHPHIEG